MKHFKKNSNPSVKRFSLSMVLTAAMAIFGWANALAQSANAPITLATLKTMIANGDDVTGVNTSAITDMSGLFHNSTFNQDISGWDVSKVTNMSGMFNGASAFNRDFNEWDVGKVANMQNMFFVATAFNQDLSGWNVCKVTNSSGFSNGTTAWTMPMPNFSRCLDPTSQPMDFTATAAGPDQIDLSWTKATGTVLPTGYIIHANETGTFTAPTDGTAPTVDKDLSNGEAVVTVNQGTGTYSFIGLTADTTYHFQIWAYHGTGSRINYLTDPEGPTVSVITKDPQALIFEEGFETDGHGSRYTASSDGGFRAGNNAHFQRTDGSDIANVSGVYTGFSGTYFWAAEDTDDPADDDNEEQTITFDPIDIAGWTDLSVSGLFGAGNENPPTPTPPGATPPSLMMQPNIYR